MSIHKENKLISKILLPLIFLLYIIIGLGFYYANTIKVDNLGVDVKPIIDSKIDEEIAKEQEKALKDTGKYKGKEKELGTDGIERTVIPYKGTQGKGYIVEYRKTEYNEINGSSTEQSYYQQVDYGSEGRTQLW